MYKFITRMLPILMIAVFLVAGGVAPLGAQAQGTPSGGLRRY